MKEKKKGKVKRNYKDTVFIDLFTSWETPISLYNALFCSDVPKDERVRYLQVSNALYTSLRCDLAFTIKDELIVIIEHQSTINENMPLRILLYIAKLYENILEEEARYRRTLKPIPTPRFVVLYNGKERFPERSELRLSDAYMLKEVGIQLDVIVPVININYGNNKEIMERCPTLNGYSYMEDRIRRYGAIDEGSKFDKAIEDCIENDMIKEYLQSEQKRVKNMLQAEYSFEKELQVRAAEEREIGMMLGIERGRLEGIERGSYETKIETARLMKSEKFDYSMIMKMTGLSKEVIEKL